ncbi:MAG TPA: hypothetical protein VF263_13645 [Longimicrobiaceae bacterium]
MISRAVEEEAFAGAVRDHEEQARGALAGGSYTREIFDFCSGRVLSVGQLQPRQDVYAGAVANVSDLNLDTRFTHRLDVQVEPPETALGALIRWLSYVRRAELQLVGLSNHGSRFFLEFESTVRQWLADHSTLDWQTESEGPLVEDLVADLHLREGTEAVVTRVRELRDIFASECTSRAADPG